MVGLFHHSWTMRRRILYGAVVGLDPHCGGGGFPPPGPGASGVGGVAASGRWQRHRWRFLEQWPVENLAWEEVNDLRATDGFTEWRALIRGTDRVGVE